MLSHVYLLILNPNVFGVQQTHVAVPVLIAGTITIFHTCLSVPLLTLPSFALPFSFFLCTVTCLCVFLSYPILLFVCIVVVFFSLSTDRKTIFFNSHQVSKPESSSDLTAVSIRYDIKTTPHNYCTYHVLKKLQTYYSVWENIPINQNLYEVKRAPIHSQRQMSGVWSYPSVKST